MTESTHERRKTDNVKYGCVDVIPKLKIKQATVNVHFKKFHINALILLRFFFNMYSTYTPKASHNII